MAKIEFDDTGPPKRTKLLNVRVTEDEKAEIQEEARRAGMDVSGYLRAGRAYSQRAARVVELLLDTVKVRALTREEDLTLRTLEPILWERVSRDGALDVPPHRRSP